MLSVIIKNVYFKWSDSRSNSLILQHGKHLSHSSILFYVLIECMDVTFVSHRVENYTSENSDLWKKVETLESANRWAVTLSDRLYVCECVHVWARSEWC